MGLQEVWTICRIFKRNQSYRKYTPERGELSTKRNSTTNGRTKTWNGELAKCREVYNNISFGASSGVEDDDDEKKAVNVVGRNWAWQVGISEPESCSSTVLSEEAREFFTNGNWDEIASVMDYAFDPYPSSSLK